MKIGKRFEVERVCSDDSMRVALSVPRLDVAKSRVMATNGKALVFVPVEVEAGDVDGPIPVEALKAARKVGGKKAENATLGLNGSASIPGGVSYPRPELGNFPDVSSFDGDALPKKGAPGTVTIALDAFLLADVVKALGSVDGVGTVEITFELDSGKGWTNAARVRYGGKSKNDAFGAIMPCTVSV